MILVFNYLILRRKMKFIKIINTNNKTIVFPVNTITYFSYNETQLTISFNNKETITISSNEAKTTAEQIEKIMGDA